MISGGQSQENMNREDARSQSNENNSSNKDKINSDEIKNERIFVMSDYENDYYDLSHKQMKKDEERFLPNLNNGTHANI